MKECIFEIRSNELIAKATYKMILEGDTSDITRPGQFVNILIDGFYLRRPISVCDREGSTLTLVYKVVGKGTEAMARMSEGASLNILVGLGLAALYNGYALERAVFVLGGSGGSGYGLVNLCILT